MANSRDLRSSASVITTGTSWKPAFWAANHLLSPAIISYLNFWSADFLTIIGWIIPRSLIEFVNSSKYLSSKMILGWFLFLPSSLIDNLLILVSNFVSPINDDNPLPKPFLILN